MIHALRTYGNYALFFSLWAWFFFSPSDEKDSLIVRFVWYATAMMLVTLSSTFRDVARQAGRDWLPCRTSYIVTTAAISLLPFLTGIALAYRSQPTALNYLAIATLCYGAALLLSLSKAVKRLAPNATPHSLPDALARSRFAGNANALNLLKTTVGLLIFALVCSFALPKLLDIVFGANPMPIEVSLLVFVVFTQLFLPWLLLGIKFRHTLSWRGPRVIRMQGWLGALFCFGGLLLATLPGFAVARGAYFNVSNLVVVYWVLSIAASAAGASMLMPRLGGGALTLWVVAHFAATLTLLVATLSLSTHPPAHPMPAWSLGVIGAALLVAGILHWHRKTSGKQDVLHIYAGA